MGAWNDYLSVFQFTSEHNQPFNVSKLNFDFIYHPDLRCVDRRLKFSDTSDDSVMIKESVFLLPPLVNKWTLEYSGIKEARGKKIKIKMGSRNEF